MSDEADKTKACIAGVFSRIAVTYDHSGPRFFSYFGRRLVELAEIPAGAKVLDIASGRGATLLPTAERVGAAGYVIGIDFAAGMVWETTAELQRLGLKNAALRQMDAERLSFPDASFDMALCGFAIFFFPRLQNALSEILRVLKPGGRIVVTTFAQEQYKEFDWFDNLIQAYLPAQAQDNEEKREQETEAEEARVFNTPAGLKKLFSEAGFKDIWVEYEKGDFVYADEEEWWAQQWSHGRRTSLERIEPDNLERLKIDFFDELQSHKQADGLHMPMQVLFTFGAKPPH
jgi:ubiquinone/menaquinone biosynthesis C-methylase UbiE